MEEFLMGVYGSPELNNNNIPTYDKNLVFCSSCGMRYSKKIKKCPQCGKKCAQPFYNKWWFWAVVAIVIFALSPQQSNVETQNNNDTKDIEIVSPVVSEEEFKANCEMVPYDDVARKPGDYTGTQVVFSGKVIQVVQEGDNKTILRVNVTQTKYGAWDDTLYVEYKRKADNESRILEDDIITLYGKMNGIKSYTSVLGNEVSIPYILVEYIEIK